MNRASERSQRLARIEASTKRIKAWLLHYLSQQTGQTEEQVWAALVRRSEERVINAAS